MSRETLRREEAKTAVQKARENYQRYIYARERGHSKYVEAHDLRDRFFFGDQWEESERQALRKTKRPALTINKIKPTILTILGEYLENRADVKFVPSAGGTREISEALTKVYRHIHKEQRLDKKELTLVMDGLITSRGYYNVRVGFDDNFMGEVRITVPNPKNVIPDPDSDSDDPNDWNEVIISSWLTIQDVELSYGKEKARKLKQNAVFGEEHDRDRVDRDTYSGEEAQHRMITDGSGDEKTQRIYHVIERQYRRIETVAHLVDQVLGDTRQIPRHWDDTDIASVLEANPNLKVERKDAQVIRWTVSSHGVLLHDDISPYKEFTIIPYFPLFRRGKTAGAVEDLIDPQRNYNKVRSEVQHIVSSTSNSGWKVKASSLVNMEPEDLETEGAKTGLVLVFRDTPEDIQRIQPNQVPQGLAHVSRESDSDIKEISGVDNETRGVARPDVAGKAIEARRQASLINTAVYFENLAFTRELLAKKILNVVQRFYSDERHFRITGQGVLAQSEEVSINAQQEDGSILNDLTVGEYDVVITPTPYMEHFDQTQFDVLKELAELNVPIPTHLFVEHSPLLRKTEVAEEIRQASGTDTPSEEERQMQQEMKRLEMEEKKASIMARQAQAQLSQARAQKVLDEVARGGLDETKLDELLLKARALDNERSRDDQSMEIRRRAQAVDEMLAIMEGRVKERELREGVAQRKQETQST